MDVLNAPAIPGTSISPTREKIAIQVPLRYPPISDLAQPMLRLAGTRVVLVARSQLKGGRLERMPVTNSSRSERTMKRFHVIDTSHSP